MDIIIRFKMLYATKPLKYSRAKSNNNDITIIFIMFLLNGNIFVYLYAKIICALPSKIKDVVVAMAAPVIPYIGIRVMLSIKLSKSEPEVFIRSVFDFPFISSSF